jgi:hypothetical protein
MHGQQNIGCGRNSELIINKYNILLKVIDTNFSTSKFTMVLNFLKVTVYVKIYALRNTLAEKHLSKILKRFTISAAPCIKKNTLKLFCQREHLCRTEGGIDKIKNTY